MPEEEDCRSGVGLKDEKWEVCSKTAQASHCYPIEEIGPKTGEDVNDRTDTLHKSEALSVVVVGVVAVTYFFLPATASARKKEVLTPNILH